MYTAPRCSLCRHQSAESQDLDLAFEFATQKPGTYANRADSSRKKRTENAGHSRKVEGYFVRHSCIIKQVREVLLEGPAETRRFCILLIAAMKK